MDDERQRLYGRAIKEREYLPIRGKWASSVRKDKERKRKNGRKQDLINGVLLEKIKNLLYNIYIIKKTFTAN